MISFPNSLELGGWEGRQGQRHFCACFLIGGQCIIMSATFLKVFVGFLVFFKSVYFEEFSNVLSNIFVIYFLALNMITCHYG